MGQHGAEPPNANQIPVVRSIFDFSTEALGQLRTWLEQNPPSIPVTQILGFSQFTAQSAPTIETNEATASTSYVDLATVGPQLTGLPDGKYVILFGCLSSTSVPGFGAGMSVQVNSTTPTTPETLVSLVSSLTPGAFGLAKTLNGGGNNTLTAKYATGGGATATYQRRWMLALRYSNA